MTYKQTDTDLRISILLSLQRALLGAVLQALRKVTVEWTAKKIIIRAYFDGDILEDDRESMECVCTEVMADFLPEMEVELEVIRKDAPELIIEPKVTINKEGIPILPNKYEVVYSRKED